MQAEQTGVLVRVSGEDQKHDSQLEVIEKWLTAQGIDPKACRWYEEKESGRKMNREGLDRLQRDIFDGKVKTVVVFKVDRIARRLRDGLNLVCDWAERGVRFISVTQQIDIHGVMGKMVAALLFGLAELEWEYRAERQAAGISAAKKKQGVYKGRKAGATKGKREQGVPARSPDRARELKAKGLQPREIAQALGVSVRTVWRDLGPVEVTPRT